MQKPKDFHIGDILSISTGQLLSPSGMGGVYTILNFLTRDEVYTHQIPRVLGKVRPWLLRQYDFLSSPEMDAAIEALDVRLAAVDEDGKRVVIEAWLADTVAALPGFQILFGGTTLPVEPLPMDDYESRDPVEELNEMVGKDRVIVVREEDL